MTRRREPDAPGRTVSIGTLRLRVSGMSPAEATALARDVADRLARDAAGGGWRSSPGVSVSVPAAGDGPAGQRVAGAVSAALVRAKGGS